MNILIEIFFPIYYFFLVFIIGLAPFLLISIFKFDKNTVSDNLLLVPFIGVGLIILVCQNLLYLDIKTSLSSLILLTISILIMMVYLFKRSIGYFLSQFNRNFLQIVAVFFIVYYVHSTGLFSAGLNNYYGYGWSDIFNYISMAQSFHDIPFSNNSTINDYLIYANHSKGDRIGQSIFHSFLISTSLLDSQQSFGFAMLTTPPLIFLAIYILSSETKFNHLTSLGIAVVCSLVPTISTIYLEGFFSQSFATPFIFLMPFLTYKYAKKLTITSTIYITFFTSIIASVYTELLPIVLISNLITYIYIIMK